MSGVGVGGIEQGDSCAGIHLLNTAEVSVLAGIVKTFADEFFGVESSKPALLFVRNQI